MALVSRKFMSNLPLKQIFATCGKDNYANFSTQANFHNVKLEDCSAEVQELHEKFMTEVQDKRTIPLALIRGIFEKCSSPEDASLAFKVLHKHRIHRSSRLHILENFNEYISALAISASLRTKSYDLGLQTLWKNNFYGLSPSLRSAHLFLNHARQEKDVKLMLKTFKTMLSNSLLPTTQTADMMLRTCKDNDEFELMFKLTHEFVENGVNLSSAAFDIVISTAANHGSVEKVLKVQGWREGAGLEHTIASAFSVAKVHVLQGEVDTAVELILSHCQDLLKAGKYVSKLVRVWPSELLSRGKLDEHSLEDLKANVGSFLKGLSRKHRSLAVDIEQFGKGEESS